MSINRILQKTDIYACGDRFGGHTTETAEKERQRKLTLAVNARRQEIIEGAGDKANGMHPDLYMMKVDKETVKALKDTLLRTSIVIGDDRDYH